MYRIYNIPIISLILKNVFDFDPLSRMKALILFRRWLFVLCFVIKMIMIESTHERKTLQNWGYLSSITMIARGLLGRLDKSIQKINNNTCGCFSCSSLLLINKKHLATIYNHICLSKLSNNNSKSKQSSERKKRNKKQCRGSIK